MGEGNGQRPARKQPAGRSCGEVAVIAAAVAFVLVVLALGLVGVTTRTGQPQPSLHSVWCARPGSPLAVPFVVGPGTGLSGCPRGDRQVQP